MNAIKELMQREASESPEAAAGAADGTAASPDTVSFACILAQALIIYDSIVLYTQTMHTFHDILAVASLVYMHMCSEQPVQRLLCFWVHL